MANYDASIRVGTKVDASALDAVQKGFDNAKNSAEKAARAIENAGKSTEKVKIKLQQQDGSWNNLIVMAEQYSAQLKNLESKGFGAGDKVYDEIYAGWIDASIKAKNALDAYNKSMYEQSDTGKKIAELKENAVVSD